MYKLEAAMPLVSILLASGVKLVGVISQYRWRVYLLALIESDARASGR